MGYGYNRPNAAIEEVPQYQPAGRLGICHRTRFNAPLFTDLKLFIRERTMGIFDWVTKSAKHTEPVFVFADGKRLSSKEYGYFTGQWSLESAQTMLADFCGAGTPGAAMPGAEIIKSKSIYATLYMTTLHMGAYKTYAEYALHVNQTVITGINQGVKDFLDGIKLPNGASLENDDKALLWELIAAFSRAIIDDIKESKNGVPGVVKPLGANMQSSMLLLGCLDRLHRGSDKSLPFLFDGILTPQYRLGCELLDSAAIGVLSILRTDLCVRLISRPEDTPQ